MPQTFKSLVKYTFCVNVLRWGLLKELEGAPLVGKVKTLPAVLETWVQSLVWEYPLKEGMATHSSTLAQRIPWTEELERLQSTASRGVGYD